MIIQGDNGTVLKITIKDEKNELVDLNGSTIKIKLKRGKVERIIDVVPTGIGVCEGNLTSEDTAVSGVYQAQATVTYLNGDVFSSSVQMLDIRSKL